jgi:hypothetical protein
MDGTMNAEAQSETLTGFKTLLGFFSPSEKICVNLWGEINS